MFVGESFPADEAVGVLFGGAEPVVAAGPFAGDHGGVVGLVVQCGEAEVADQAEVLVLA